jgi:trans-2,3-dihydro-3-hydroxyanthranilate isomerase
VVLHQYLLYDVFTHAPFSGNALAVFPDARGIAVPDMQRIARELNLSETTFVLPAERRDTDVRMRIFTPQVEMPMAGHPTVGSAFALAHAGVIAPGRGRFVFGLNVGPVPVDLAWSGGTLSFVWMTQGAPAFGRTAPRGSVAEAVGLTAGDLLDDPAVQEVSCGVPYWIVPVRDRAAVDRAAPDAANLRRLGERAGGSLPVYLFARDADGRDEFYCRMFAPGLGVLEDPATGSAAGPLGCYAVQHGLALANESDTSSNTSAAITIRQGVAMGRPSRMHVEVAGAPAAITSVRVGGPAVLIGRGELHL